MKVKNTVVISIFIYILISSLITYIKAESKTMNYNHITFLKNYHCVKDLPCYYPITKYFFKNILNMEKIIEIEDSEVSNNKYIAYLDYNSNLKYNSSSELENEEISELTKKYLPDNDGVLKTIEEHTDKILWGIEETTQITIEKLDKFNDIIYSYKFRISDPFKDSNTDKKLDSISKYLRNNSVRFENCLIKEINEDNKFDNNNLCKIFTEIFPS